MRKEPGVPGGEGVDVGPLLATTGDRLLLWLIRGCSGGGSPQGPPASSEGSAQPQAP